MVEHASGTVAFFHAMAPVLLASRVDRRLRLLLRKIHQKELAGEEEGRLTYLWLIIMVFLFMIYGLYTWRVYSFKK